MAYVITRLCRDCVDTSCASVCPKPDCIVEHRPGEASSALPHQLFIRPSQCIDCGACEPECPWEAIFQEDDVPAGFAADIALNAIADARPDEFVEAIQHPNRKPDADEIEKNRRRWNITGAVPEPGGPT